MNDLHLLDRFGPEPTALSATATGAARERLNAAMAQAPSAKRRSRRRAPLLAAAAAAVIGLSVTPVLVGSDGSVALAAVDPLTFPLTPKALPSALGDPVFERDSDFMAAQYGSTLNGVSIVTDVKDKDFWSIPNNSPKTEIDGRHASVISRTVYDGTPDHAPAVSVIWKSDDNMWTAVTGSGSYADAARVEAIAQSLRKTPQPVDLTLSVAPKGWSVVAYKEDRILTLAAPGETGRDLTVALVDRLSPNLSEYGAQDVATLTINDAPAQLGRRPTAAGDQTWILEAQTSNGQTFSLQAPAGFTRDHVIRIAESVTYRQ